MTTPKTAPDMNGVVAENVRDGVESSKHDVWYLKGIVFGEGEGRRATKIITQSFNGPCSFIAICNILILRGSIQVLPKERRTVSYEFLSQLVADFLLATCPDLDISAALSIMPRTQKGMDLNPVFTSATSFRPAGDGGELKLFEQAGIKLVHGWLVDPDSPEAVALTKTPDYDSAVNLIALADYTSKGQLVQDENIPGSSSQAGPSTTSYTEEERERIEDAMTVRAFLDMTQSQLTYHGLFHLASTLPPDTPVALFRNSHLSVLYRPPGPEPSLYTLVTDHVFLYEASVVWERLEDVDGTLSSFVDSDFVRSTPAGGDFAGMTGESTLRALEMHANPETDPEQFALVDPADQALAMQLQAEEDAHARKIYEQRERARERSRDSTRNSQRSRDSQKDRERRAALAREEEERQKPNRKTVAKKASCLIM